MAETKIIKAVFGAVKSIITQPRYRYDYGQIIEVSGITLPESFEARFSNAPTGTSVRVLGSNQRVAVPDDLMRTGKSVWCYITVHDAVTDGRTMYSIRIPIRDATERTDAEPTPVQQDVIEQAIAALNAAVEQTAQDVEAADASAQSASDSADRAEAARDTAEGYVGTVQGYTQQAQTSATNASSSATASANSASQAQQIKTDVEGMVDEAQSAAGASAQSALESAQSASQASVSASSASQSADTASTKASEASASAQTASAKATEASEYASTASQKASEASQSASAASGYATAAGQAKTAAETAQGLAEQAQSDAESAKDDAESARDETQQIASGISGKVEQIDQNTADIASLEADRYKAYATDTATGAVASFPDGANDVPMVDVTVQIEPVQDLSHGDPSPDNICPISGWNGANISRVGVNVWDEEWESGYINNSTGEFVASQNYIRTKNFVSIVPGKSYYIKTPVALKLIAYDANKTFLRAITSTWANEVITGSAHLSDVYYIKFYNAASGALTTYNHDISINYPATDTDYHPYTGNLYPITFPAEAGTVYGGTLDVTTGELVADRANIASYNGETLPPEWISDRDKYVAGTTPTTGAQVCYELATPITYQLNPQEITSLLGTNNVWADTGDTEVEYRADATKYINKKITEAVSALT